MSASEFEGLELATGVVRGVRSFRIDKMGRLTGINYPQVWRPGENEAECRKSEDYSYARLQSLMLGSGGWSARRMAPLTYSYSNSSSVSNFQSGNVSVEWDAATDTVTVDDGYSIHRMSRPAYEQMMVTRQAPKPPEPHPMDKCKHGFYAYYDGSNDYHDQGEVTGVVEGYGEVLIGTRGFRCMKARIVALRVHGKSVNQITGRVARNYADIPQFESFAQMVAEFPPDGGENSVTPDDPDFWTRSI